RLAGHAADAVDLRYHEAMSPSGEARLPSDTESPLVREFALELARNRRSARGDVERERRGLDLMALERERLVDVHYSGPQPGGRVARAAGPAARREPVRSAPHR